MKNKTCIMCGKETKYQRVCCGADDCYSRYMDYLTISIPSAWAERTLSKLKEEEMHEEITKFSKRHNYDKDLVKKKLSSMGVGCE